MARLTCAFAPDAAGPVLARFIESATRTLDVAAFEIDSAYGELIEAVNRAGVKTRVVVDSRPGGNAEVLARLGEAGVATRVVRLPDASAHARLLVVDGRATAVGSGDLLQSHVPLDAGGPGASRPGSHDWWLVLEDAPTLGEVARSHVSRLWDRAGAPLQVLQSRDDGRSDLPLAVARPPRPPQSIELPARRVRFYSGGGGVAGACRDLLVDAAERAWALLPHVQPASPRAHELIALLTGVGRRGADARLLLGLEPDAEDFGTLASLGIEVRVASRPESLPGHARGLIVDGSVLVTSANWTDAGLGRNDEAALAIDHADAAAYFASRFEEEWERAAALAELAGR